MESSILRITYTNELNIYKMNTRYIMSAIVIFLTSAAISAGCAVNVKENTEKQTIATKANRTDKNFGSSEAFLKKIINGLNNYPTDSKYDSAFRNNSTDKKFIFQIHQATKILSENTTVGMTSSFLIIWHCAQASYELCIHMSRILKHITTKRITPAPPNEVCIIKQ